MTCKELELRTISLKITILASLQFFLLKYWNSLTCFWFVLLSWGWNKERIRFKWQLCSEILWKVIESYRKLSKAKEMVKE